MNIIHDYSNLMVEQTKPSALATNMNKVKKLISALNEAEFLKFISNLSISNNNKKKLLTQICKKTGLEEYQYIFWTVVDFRNSDLFIKVLEQFVIDAANKLEQKNITIYTAFELKTSTVNKIVKKVSSYINKKVNYKVVVDKELIGGFIIKGDDFNIDKSINNNIENMFKGMVGGDNV